MTYLCVPSPLPFLQHRWPWEVLLVWVKRFTVNVLCLTLLLLWEGRDSWRRHSLVASKSCSEMLLKAVSMCEGSKSGLDRDRDGDRD